MSDEQTQKPVRKRSRWIERILICCAVVVVVLVIVISLQPAEFHVSRSATMKAPPAAVFAEVNDFHHWQPWSPWAKLDPEAKNTFEGPSAGTGSIFRWDGNSSVGQGTMTITESRPNELVGIKLDFIKPFAGTSNVKFTFEPQGDQTAVTWSMVGEKNFLAKAIHLVINMDKMIGGNFEAGLANLKAVVEAKGKQ